MNFLKQLLISVPGLPLYIFLMTFLYGAYEAFIKDTSSYYKKVLLGYINEEDGNDDLFLKTGWKITKNKYTLLLCSAGTVIFILLSLTAVFSGKIVGIPLGLLLGGILIFLFFPRKYLYRHIVSPFYKLTELLSKNRCKELDRELFNSISLLKNVAIASGNKPMSGDKIIEILMENSKKLKPVYARTLSIYRQGDKAEALKRFKLSVGTQNAANFAMLLEKIDKTNPVELTLQIKAQQEIMQEARYTKGMEKAESKGNAIFSFATISCFICLLNMVFVCVLMDAMKMLGDVL